MDEQLWIRASKNCDDLSDILGDAGLNASVEQLCHDIITLHDNFVKNVPRT